MARLTRENDDMILRWLELRTEGIESKEIAEEYGITAGYVRSATNKVVNHDAEYHDDQIAFGGPKK